MDTFTPLNKNAFLAALGALDCALSGAQALAEGRHLAYALVRPPGHHAERRLFGGFCYLNSAAAAAEYLSAFGRVAMLDIDYHHGNGQQDIFYRRSDVLTVSLHGHPRFAYPYFTGFDDERGEGEGEGFNLNLPLPESLDGRGYRQALERALKRIEAFNPQFLVVALGLDSAKGDPTGTWSLRAKDFEANGQMIGMLGLPTLVVQEGGYRNRTLGLNARSFLVGLAAASTRRSDQRREVRDRMRSVVFRREPDPGDPERIRRLVSQTGFFSPAEVDVAEELVRERLQRGEASGYHFILAEHFGQLAGYACFGPIACTTASYDLFWIAVHPDFQGRGLGRRLLTQAERLIRESGGQRIYVETSQRVQYDSTRAFYDAAGYRLESVLPDFYAPGDGKAVYCKILPR